MQRMGYTLPEMLIAIVLISMLALIGLAPVRGIRDTAVVRREQQRLADALERARGAAVRLGVPTRLAVTDTAYRITAVTLTGDSVLAWRDHGPQGEGVLLSGGGAPLIFGPSGVAMGASNRTMTLRRGAVVRTVVVSRLGRITR